METYNQNGYRIAMSMHDNDFNSTVEAFLGVVKRMWFEPTKEQLQLLWSELSFGLYLASQGYRHWPDPAYHDKPDNHTRVWLLEEMKIFVGAEVEERHKDRESWDNAETWVFDTRLPEEAQIYCY